ncbi:MAG: ATP-binding cassette domain-containing protein [Prevotellaceae bacterium]|nr:ATP-binding cassette domain-containing protein [Prevotellaceae bacterium]
MEDSERIRSSQIWEVPSYTFKRNCRICIHAESGSGKSSLLSFIFGNRRDYKGEILFNDRNINEYDIEQWCRVRTENIALLPQEMRLFPELTVIQNIELKNKRTNHKNSEQINSLLDRMGILEKRDTKVGKLSIGQQQRVALVRSICQPFDFIFLDEPVSHLDSNNNKIAAEIIEEEARKQNAGIIATSVGNHLLLDNAEFISL